MAHILIPRICGHITVMQVGQCITRVLRGRQEGPSQKELGWWKQRERMGEEGRRMGAEGRRDRSEDATLLTLKVKRP